MNLQLILLEVKEEEHQQLQSLQEGLLQQLEDLQPQQEEVLLTLQEVQERVLLQEVVAVEVLAVVEETIALAQIEVALILEIV